MATKNRGDVNIAPLTVGRELVVVFIESGDGAEVEHGARVTSDVAHRASLPVPLKVRCHLSEFRHYCELRLRMERIAFVRDEPQGEGGNMRTVTSVLTTTLLLLSGVANVFANGYIEIQAQIDGRDQLILKGSTAQWHHFDFAAVGRERGGNAPTLIGGMRSSTDTSILWLPVWPLPPPDEIRSEALSSVLQGLQPSIPSNGTPWQVEKAFGRGAVTIVEQPTPANAFTLIVEFDDNRFGGSSFYGVILSQAPVKVQIDVKPYLTSAGIKLESGLDVRVAVMGGGEFDALQVNPASWTSSSLPLLAMQGPRKHLTPVLNGYEKSG